MKGFEEIKEITAEVVADYGKRISAVEEIIGESLSMLDRKRRAEQIVQSNLRETLAKAESLRKKDFDVLTAPLLAYQEKKEGDIRQFLMAFLEKQRVLAEELQKMIQAGSVDKIPEIEKKIHGVIFGAKSYIISFQKEQTLIAESLKTLFEKREQLTLKEFKMTLELLETRLGFGKPDGQIVVH